MDTLTSTTFPSVTLCDQTLVPELRLHPGECLQLVVPEEMQEELIDEWLFSHQKEKHLKGLGLGLGFVLNGRGLIANLSIKENLMLPILYHHSESAETSLASIDALLDETDLKPLLGELAGLRSARVNNHISLCRCVLQKASYIVMQQPQSSMSKKEARAFTKLALQVIEGLHAGVLYITASKDDCGGFSAHHQINVTAQESRP